MGLPHALMAGQTPSRYELDDRFGPIKWIFNVCMVVVGAAFALGTRSVLVWANQYLASPRGQPLFEILPQNAIWWIFPFFAALTLAFEITLQLWSLFDRNEADLYGHWSGLGATFRWVREPVDVDVRRMLRWSALFITLPIGILTILALPMHTVFTQDQITDCGYAFAACKVYRYSDARRMTIIDGFRTTDGRLTPRAGIVVDFKDGRRWSSGDEGDFNSTVDPRLKELMTNLTDLPYGYAQTEADIR